MCETLGATVTIANFWIVRHMQTEGQEPKRKEHHGIIEATFSKLWELVSAFVMIYMACVILCHRENASQSNLGKGFTLGHSFM